LRASSTRERARQTINGLLLPRAHLIWITLCFAAISCMVRSPRNAASATLALNWSENFRRFVIYVFLHKVGIHLNRLSDCAGPLQPETQV
jgi:hypothetical protein